jgi:hypothetical protein
LPAIIQQLDTVYAWLGKVVVAAETANEVLILRTHLDYSTPSSNGIIIPTDS